MKSIFTRSIIAVTGWIFVLHAVRADVDLPVPYYWQANAQWCGITSATMVARYYANPSNSNPIKPWFSAVTLGADKNTGSSVSDEVTILNSYLPGVAFHTDTWSSDSSQRETLKTTIIGKLDQGHPVLVHINSRSHGIVLTGYQGKDWKTGKVFINDPSGVIYHAQVHAATKWNELFDTVDKFQFADLFGPQTKATILYADTTFARSGDSLSLDLTCSGFAYIGNTITAIPSSVRTPDAPDAQLVFQWDGKAHPGYYFQQGSSNEKKRPNLGPPNGTAFLDSDTIDVYPRLHETSRSRIQRFRTPSDF